LLAVLLPAVQQARGAGRLTQCSSNLHQLGVATHAYEQLHRMFPPGSTNFCSMFTQMLPLLGESALQQRIDFSKDCGSQHFWEANRQTLRTKIELLICPADPHAGSAAIACNYTGSWGRGMQVTGRFDGFFRPLGRSAQLGIGPVLASTVTDGLSNTLAYSEGPRSGVPRAPLTTLWDVPVDFPRADQLAEFSAACENLDLATARGIDFGRGTNWWDGTPGETMHNHVQTPNRRSCTNNGNPQTGAFPPSSQHPGGVSIRMADGNVRFLSEAIDRTVWQALGSVDGNDLARW